MKQITTLAAALITGLLLSGCQSTTVDSSNKSADQPPQPNVLFVLIDDLRVQHGPYVEQLGQTAAKVPNLDKLSEQGVSFTRAFSNVPVCGASRASMLTGLWPSSERFLAFNSAEQDAPNAISLPKHFKNNGYTTVSLGKVFNNFDDSLDSWSEQPWRPDSKIGVRKGKKQTLKIRGDYQSLAAQQTFEQTKSHGLAYEAADVNDSSYHSGRIVKKAKEKLQQYQQTQEPFFLAVGIKKPHLPFNAPKKYWDMYAVQDIQLANNPNAAKDAPKAAIHQWNELRNYHGMPKGKKPMPDDEAKKLIHGYLAATSYADALVGELLDSLESLNLDDNTIVVVWGDHGWSLGQHGLWAKHSPYNVANQIPLLVRAPSTSGRGFASNLVESIDIYPTLTELAKLTTPSHVQGKSLVPQLQSTDAAGKKAVFTRWKGADTIRTDKFHYTEWRNKQGKVTASMLFNHHKDKNENKNLAQLPGYQKVVKRLSARLAKHIDALHQEQAASVESTGEVKAD